MSATSTDIKIGGIDSMQLTNLHTGLTTAEYEGLLAQHGRNEVVVEEVPEWIKVASRYFGLVPMIMLFVALLSASVVNTCSAEDLVETEAGCQCQEISDWPSFALLIFELNLVVWADYLGEKSSGNAINELKRLSAPTCRVKRNGEWESIPKVEIVPGDIVALVIGASVPADGLLRGDGPPEKFAPLKIDAASVTGEPLPETKYVGEHVLAATTVLSGELEMQVTKTGEFSSMGETLKLISEVGEKGGKLKNMLGYISKSIALIALFFCIIIFLVSIIRDGSEIAQAIKLVFVILVAVLPVAMPVVVTTGLAVGALELSGEKAIVQRLSAIEEMAGMDILCSDKTGTLTLGKMSISKEDCVPFEGFDLASLLLMSLLSSRRENCDAIDTAVCNAFSAPGATGSDADKASPTYMKEVLAGYEELHFDPFSPLTKKVTATILVKETGESFLVAKGAPEVMNTLPGIDADVEKRASEIVEEKAARAFKTLAVCKSFDEGENWVMVGYLCIADPPRHDSADTIRRAQLSGVVVKMITGDQKKIAVEIAKQLHMGGAIFGPEIWLPNSDAVDQAGGIEALSEMANGFASVKPKHKHRVVTALQDIGHTVGMTGDGVNDAPALKVANVGIAVAGATDAAKGAADIILTEEGLSTIVTAINRSRMIFKRLEAYIIYRLASSFFILGFFVLSICALKFDFPTWCLILLSLINDFTVLATSKDNVRPSTYPLRWNLPKDVMIAGMIGGVGILQTFLMLFFTQNSADYPGMANVGLGGLEDCEIVAVIYLNIAICIQFNIFAARNKRFFWMTAEEDDASPLPSLYLVAPVALACVFSTFIAVYWDEGIALGGGNPMKGVGWVPAIAVWIWCLTWFIVVEICKVTILYLSESENAFDLFFAPLGRVLLRKPPHDGVGGDGEELAPNAEDEASHFKLAISGTVLPYGKLPSAGVMAAANEPHPPLQLPSIGAVKDTASTADLVSIINSMRQHILMLEERLVELDGVRVVQAAVPHDK